ncbi:MAG TPA: protein-methionine-sulfoxide reductase heme-binding subunit MsrQ, partial [Thermodesulfobacteriota bacterium]|nr:protein-methionine-sulfoxide reductase heme-binding subunit MsrQ [Thermodesulfobacteriota bacterium]
MPHGRLVALKAAVWAASLAPLLLLAHRAATDDLGANPISAVTTWLGDWALRLLLASLAMTPLHLLTGASWPLALRRLLGLFAFFYASLHLAVWIGLDHFFDWAAMAADVVKRPYITAGMSAFVLLLPLAATSTRGMMRRLGGRAWRRLHRLVYLVGILAVLHYAWLAKVGVLDPYYYAAVLALLLGVRLVAAARRRLTRRRARAAARAG